MEEEQDSRTAAFSSRRACAEFAYSENSRESSASIPIKRRRRAHRPIVQSLDDFVPSGGSFSTNAAFLVDEHIGNEGSSATGQLNSESELQEINMPPSKNWNTGAKAKIRVSLRDVDAPPVARSQQPPQGIEDNTDNSQRPRRSNADADDKDQHELAVAEGRRLYVGNAPYAATEADLRDFFCEFSIEDVKIPVNPRTSRSVGYAFVTLSNSYDATRAIELLNGSPVADRKVSVQLARPGNGKQEPESKSQDSRSQVKAKVKAEVKEASRLDIGKESSSKPRSDETFVFVDSSDPSNLHISSGIEGQACGTAVQTQPYPFKPLSPGSRPSKKRESTAEGEGDMLVKIQDESEHESGEISDSYVSTTESHPQAKRGATTFDGVNSDVESNSEGRSESPEDSDAMIDYADSGALRGHTSSRYASFQASPPRTLGQLDRRDMDLQLRYFYVAKARDEVDLRDPVRCLICTEEGHMAAVCDKVQCSRCGERNTHCLWNCPLLSVCSRCKEPGHSGPACRSPFQRPESSAMCEICKRQGHVALDCELRWRTSGRPWESNLEDKRIRFECYECGRSGHLGNDCPTRQPRKVSGSSSWTYHRHTRQADTGTRGINIKGRAQQQRQQKQAPIMIDDNDDDAANFYRPKAAAPARPGQIRIMAGGGLKAGNAQSQNQLAYNSNRGSDEQLGNRQRSASPHRMDYNERQDYRLSSGAARYAPAVVDSGHRYTSSYGQPPLPREPPPHRRGSPPLPVERRKVSTAEAYRPMPSSGRQAWKQFRM
ncbi:MAG: hypothetical protein LQ344_007982 [Seirophora lacunosa]|nr:MAG: hypothetical protein LQ344_007982 [Seirophora lacunosa]